MTTRLIRLPEVEALCGLRRSTIYSRIKRGQFPRPVPLGGRCVAWIAQEIEDWIRAQITGRGDA